VLEGVREGDSGVAGAQCNFAGMALSNRQTMSAVRVAQRIEQCRQGRAVIGAAAMADYTDFTTDPSKGNGFAGGDWGDPDVGIL